MLCAKACFAAVVNFITLHSSYDIYFHMNMLIKELKLIKVVCIDITIHCIETGSLLGNI